MVEIHRRWQSRRMSLHLLYGTSERNADQIIKKERKLANVSTYKGYEYKTFISFFLFILLLL